MTAITLNNRGTFIMDDSIYCMSPSAFANAIQQLRRMGYNVKDRSERKDLSYTATPEQQRIYSGSGWIGELQTARVGKCGTCKSYISNLGIQTHGHTCEICGAVTYYELVEKSRIRFEFRVEIKKDWWPAQLSMDVHHWDTDAGFLYLKYRFFSGGLSVVTDTAADDLLAQHRDKWEVVTMDGEKLLKVAYKLRIPQRGHNSNAIEITDSYGSYRNFMTLELWDLQEYPNDGFPRRNLPLPTFVYLNKAWKWAPLSESPTLYKSVIAAAGVSTIPSHYEQWPEATWKESTYRKMQAFIERFTSLNMNRVNALIMSFSRNPLVGMDQMRALCDTTYTRHVFEEEPAFKSMRLLTGGDW